MPFDIATALHYIPLVLKYLPTVKGILDMASTNGDIVTKLKAEAQPVVSMLEEIGSYLFPNASAEIHAVGGAIAAFDPNIVKWVQGSCNSLMQAGLVVDGVYGTRTRD